MRVFFFSVLKMWDLGLRNKGSRIEHIVAWKTWWPLRALSQLAVASFPDF